MKNKSAIAIVVIYNKSGKDSVTLTDIEKYSLSSFLKVVVFDNSVKDYGNKDFCRDKGYTYFGFGINKGLSYAYNYVIDRLWTERGYFIILDDDTLLSEDYVSRIKEITSDAGHDDEIFLPIVKAGELILSPSNIKFKSGSKVVRNLKDIRKNKITAINSGMIVGMRVYASIRYNEALFLDCVDHDFMRRARQKNIVINIMQCEINQNYSRTEQIPIDRAKYRFCIYKKDFKRYAEMCNGLSFYQLSIFKFALHQSYKYKTPWFIVQIFQ